MYVIATYFIEGKKTMTETAIARIEVEAIAPISESERALRQVEAAWVQFAVDTVSSQYSKTAYRRGATDFLDWWRAQGRPPLRKAVVQNYAAGLATAGMKPANINLRLSAIRAMIRQAAENRMIDELDAKSAAAVKGVKSENNSAGTWLSKEQAETLINHIERKTLAGKRDFALLCLFLTSGLRRSEMASLTFEHIQQREGRWAIVGIVGKGQKIRDVAIPGYAKQAVDAWREAAGLTDGRIFRAVNKGDKLSGDSMTPESIRMVLERQINRVNDQLVKRGIESLPMIAAHDLRRTFAQLARKGNAKIEQIQFALGHSSVATTERYLGGKQDFTNAPCDGIGLNVAMA